MTVLTALQNAAVRLIGRKPNTFFGATATFEMEATILANEVASDIATSHDWQALTKIATFTGDGVTTAFSPPADYDRMCVASDIADQANWFWSYTPVSTINDWISLQNGNMLAAHPGWWILLEDQFQFLPAPPADTAAQFPYVSNYYAKDSGGTAKDAFTTDTDVFRLDEKLLTLGVIWKWREMKQLTTGGEKEDFERAYSDAVARDRGSRTIRTPSRRSLRGSIAWPYSLTGY